MGCDGGGLSVRRVRMPSSGVESWTVVGPDGGSVELVDEFLGWLTGIERSPNTVEAYARDLGLFWSFLAERGVVWDRVSVVELGEFAAWARRPAANVLVLSEQAARRSASTVNRMLTAVMSFYEFQGRRGNELARDLVVRTRSGRGGYKPFLHGIARVAAAGPAGAAARASAAAADVELGAGGGGDRLSAAVAGSVLVRVVGVDGDAGRPGVGVAPRGHRLLGAADRDRAARGRRRPGAVKGRRARVGAGAG